MYEPKQGLDSFLKRLLGYVRSTAGLGRGSNDSTSTTAAPLAREVTAYCGAWGEVSGRIARPVRGGPCIQALYWFIMVTVVVLAVVWAPMIPTGVNQVRKRGKEAAYKALASET